MALGGELAVPFPRWGVLAPELGAGCGLRWGEQFQLTAYDVFLDEHQYTAEGWPLPFIAVEAQVDGSALVKDGGNRRKLPKLEKTRSVGIPPVSFTGYPLREELRRRRDQALEEQASGTNPGALLFPTLTGKMFHHTAFSNQYLVPAALRCTQSECPTRTWTETYAKRDKGSGSYIESTRTRTQLLLTWHSLRHRFARTCVDILKMEAGELMAMGGWESETVVRNRYYRSGKEHVVAGLKKFELMGG